jgi:tetratricopeptide (TPR) repeat protein
MLGMVLFSSRAVGEELLREAERAYHEGQFQEASVHYRRLVERGAASGAVFYNLANAELRLGEVGWAVLFYRRAALLLPRDADIKENLRIARARSGESEHEEGLGVAQLLAFPRLLLSQSEAEWCFLVLVALFSGSVWVSGGGSEVLVRNRKRAQWFVVGVGGITLWLAVDLTFAAYDGSGRPTWSTARGEGREVPVVFVQTSRLTQAPTETAALGREVAAGSEALAWFPGGEWIKILGPGGGWIKVAGREPVIQRVQ